MELIEKVKEGDKPSAGHTNKIVDAVNEVMNPNTNKDALDFSLLGTFRNQVVNKTGENRKAYEIGVISDAANKDLAKIINSGTALIIEKPSASDRGKFVVFKSAINANASGKAFLAGQTLVYIKRTATDAAASESERFAYADVADGESVLVAQPTGAARIDWEDTSEEDLTKAHMALITFGSGSQVRLQRFRIKSEQNDYLVCHTFDALTSTEGTVDVAVAKPKNNREALQGIEEDSEIIAMCGISGGTGVTDSSGNIVYWEQQAGALSMAMPENPYEIKHDNTDNAGEIDINISDLGKAGTDFANHDGIEHWYPGNVVYNSDGEHILYRMWRVVTINRYGLIVRIRDEDEEVIDIPGTITYE